MVNGGVLAVLTLGARSPTADLRGAPISACAASGMDQMQGKWATITQRG
jgi:hypothetical protein